MPKKSRSSLALVVAIAGPVCVAEASLTIQDEAPACLVAEAYPRLSVQITPADQVVRARLLFRPDTQLALPTAASNEAEAPPPQGWYAVALKRDGDSFRAVLPRPRMGAGRVRYVVEATDSAATSVRGEERSVEVVGSPEACGARKTAESLSSAQVDVELPPGAPWTPPVPQGFSPVGATAAGNLPKLEAKGHKGLFLAVGAVAAAGAGAASLASHSPSPDVVAPPVAPRTGDVVIVSTSPAAGSQIHESQPTLSVILRVVLPEDAHGISVQARLYRAGSSGLQCGSLRGGTNGGPATTPVVVQVDGLDGFSPCGIVDRLHVSILDEQGREILATGTTARPDLVTNFFLSS